MTLDRKKEITFNLLKERICNKCTHYDYTIASKESCKLHNTALPKTRTCSDWRLPEHCIDSYFNRIRNNKRIRDLYDNFRLDR